MKCLLSFHFQITKRMINHIMFNVKFLIMRTTKLIIAMSLVLLFAACKKTNDPTSLKNGSSLLGQLSYMANPFNPTEDSVLCLNSIRYVNCVTYTDAYYSYIKELLSSCGGTFEETETPAPRNDNHILFHPQSEVRFFPIRNGKLISVMDEKEGCVRDSIKLIVSIEVGDRKDVSTATIYMTSREKETGDYSNEFYIGDFVSFEGNDHMQPPFISDSTTLAGTQIVCFDGDHGPVSATISPQK